MGGASGCMSVTGVLFVVTASGSAVAQALRDHCADLGELRYLLRRQRVEQVGSDAFDVTGRSGRERRESGVGQDGELAAAIGRAALAAYPTVRFEPCDGMGQPTA